MMKIPTEPPEINMPTDSADNIQPGLALRWSSESSAEFYHVQVSKDKFKTVFIDDSAFVGSIFLHSENPWEHLKEYQWRVRAGNHLGYGPWTKIYTFTCFDYSVGIENTEEIISNFKVFPNPSSKTTHIVYYMKKPEKVVMNLFDSFGNQLDNLFSLYKDKGLHFTVFDASGYPSGIYFYSIQTANQKLTGNLIIIK